MWPNPQFSHDLVTLLKKSLIKTSFFVQCMDRFKFFQNTVFSKECLTVIAIL